MKPSNPFGWSIHLTLPNGYTYNYRPAHESEEFEADHPGVLQLLSDIPWESEDPGVFFKVLRKGGIRFRTYDTLCQDCGTEDLHIFMVLDEMWERLYPDDGMVCLACFEKKLGRPLVAADLTKAFCNTTHPALAGITHRERA